MNDSGIIRVQHAVFYINLFLFIIQHIHNKRRIIIKEGRCTFMNLIVLLF